MKKSYGREGGAARHSRSMGGNIFAKNKKPICFKGLKIVPLHLELEKANYQPGEVILGHAG